MSVNYVYITNDDDFLLAVQEISDYISSPLWTLEGIKPLLGLDLETTGDLLMNREGTKPIKNVPLPICWNEDEPTGMVRTIQIGLNPIDNPKRPNTNKQFIIDCFFVDNSLIVEKLKPILETVNIIGHNIKYDYQFMFVQFGIDFKYIIDTMIISKVLLAGDPVNHGLDDSYQRFLDYSWFRQVTKNEEYPNGMSFEEYIRFKKQNQSSDWSGVLTSNQLRYAAEDVFFIFYLLEQQLEWLKEFSRVYETANNNQKIINIINLENKLVPAYALMEIRGFPFDVERHEEVLKILAEKQKEALDNLGFTRKIKIKRYNEWCLLKDQKVHKIGRIQDKVTWEEEIEEDLNLRSPQQLVVKLNELFQKDLGPEFRLTKKEKGQVKDTTGEDDIKEAFYRNYGNLSDYTKDKLQWILQYKKSSSMNSKFGTKLIDFCTPRGFIHASWWQIGEDEDAVDTGRSSCSKPNCFPGYVEVLTEHGWMKWDCVTKGVKLAQYDLTTKDIDFQLPNKLIKYDFEGNLYRYKTEQFLDIEATPDHDIYYVSKNNGKWRNRPWKKGKITDLKQDYIVPTAGQYIGGNLSFSLPEIVIMAAVQADSYIEKYSDHVCADFVFAKKRKIDRLIWALDQLKLPYIVRPKGTETRIRVNPLPNYLNTKYFGNWILNLDRDSFKLLAEEVWFWDGCANRKTQYTSEFKFNSDWVQILQVLTGISAAVYQRIVDGKPYWDCNSRHRAYTWTSINPEISHIPYKDKVYCASMPKETLIIRHNNKVCIVGNCQQLPGNRGDLFPFSKNGFNGNGAELFRQSFKAKPGWKLVVADFSQIEPRIAAEVCGVKELIKRFQDAAAGIRPFDIHAWVYKIMKGCQEEPDKKSFERQYIGKTAGLSILYGKYWTTLKEWMFKKTDGKVDWTDEEAETAWNNFFANAPEFKVALRKWERQAKQKVESNGFSLDFAKRPNSRGKIVFALPRTKLGRPRRFTLKPKHFDLPDECLYKDHEVCKYCSNRDKDGKLTETYNNVYKERIRAAVTEGFNHQIQGLAADIMKTAVFYINQKLKELNYDWQEGIVAVVHDEIILHVKEEHAEEAKKWLQECMERAGAEILKEVPVLAEAHCGSSWFDAKG